MTIYSSAVIADTNAIIQASTDLNMKPPHLLPSDVTVVSNALHAVNNAWEPDWLWKRLYDECANDGGTNWKHAITPPAPIAGSPHIPFHRARRLRVDRQRRRPNGHRDGYLGERCSRNQAQHEDQNFESANHSLVVLLQIHTVVQAGYLIVPVEHQSIALQKFS